MLLAPAAVSADSIQSSANRAVIGIGVDATHVAQRVCYYQDHAYSEGAMIQVGDHVIQCAAANHFETNGALKWQPINKENDPGDEQAVESAIKRYSVN